ncbi:MAG: sensor histidine kinase [Ruminococcus sp.]|nr:sensor histidine kinase [Ruminococcus sp.]
MFNLSVYEVIEIINAIPEILIIVLFYHRIFDRKYNHYSPYIISYGIAFAVLSVTSLLIVSPYVRIGITFAILLTFAMLLYNGSNTVKFFASVYYLLIVFISETLFVGILTIMGYGNPSELLESNMGRILGMIGTKIFDFWIIVYSCRIYKNKVKSLPFRYWLLIILMPFLSAIILNQIFPTNHSGNNVMIGYIISVCGVLYLNFSVFNYFESYDKQIRLATLEQIMERESENYRAIAGSYAEIRNIKHDLKNQVTVLNDLLKDSKYAEAKQHINQLYNDVERVTSVCYTGNSAVDSIINLKGDYARSRNISFMNKIKVNSIDFETISICRILGNALDNAIEACERMDIDEKCVCITIHQLDNKLIIEIENTSPPVDVNNLITSKKNKEAHGIGMQSIRQTVESMNGYVSCNYENGYFSIKIVLNK